MLCFRYVQVKADNENNDDDEDDWTRNESKMCFSPHYNNVLFASALDGWAFGQIDDPQNSVEIFACVCFFVYSIHHFADLYAKKLSIKREVLLKTLWGDYYFDKKTKRVYKGAQV